MRLLIRALVSARRKRTPVQTLTHEQQMAACADNYRAMLEANAHNFSPTGCDYSREEKMAMTCEAFAIDHDAERARQSAKKRELRRIVWQPKRLNRVPLASSDVREVTRHKRKRYGRSQAITDQARRVLLNVKICAYCGQTPETDRDDLGPTWHIDHVVPISKGGADDLSNMVKACRRCNLRKSAKTWVPRYGTPYADGHIETRRTTALAR